jgi:hypothetical protein
MLHEKPSQDTQDAEKWVSVFMKRDDFLGDAMVNRVS